jgi:hypothetical protein
MHHRPLRQGDLHVSGEKQVQITPSHSISRICTGTGRPVMAEVWVGQDVVADLGRDRFGRAASCLWVPTISSVQLRRRVVFVEESAEPIVSVDVQMRDRGGVGDRSGSGCSGRAFATPRWRRSRLWCRFVLAQGVQQMRLLPDQRPVEQFVAAGCDLALRPTGAAASDVAAYRSYRPGPSGR